MDDDDESIIIIALILFFVGVGAGGVLLIQYMGNMVKLNNQMDYLCLEKGYDERVDYEETLEGVFVQCQKWNITNSEPVKVTQWFKLKGSD